MKKLSILTALCISAATTQFSFAQNTTTVPVFYINDAEINSNEYREFVPGPKEWSSYLPAPPDGYKSIMQEQSEEYSQYDFASEEEWDALRYASVGKKQAKQNSSNKSMACNLNKRVFGWHPYWMGTSYNNYDWELLSDLSFFSYEVDAATGNAITTHGWSTANVVTVAQANGVNVNLCVTLFSSHATLLGNATSKQTLISNLISLVQQRNANGVNIDFEGVPAAQSAAFTAFMIDLCNQMHAAIPGSEVSIALPAVNWSNVYDVTSMAPYVDVFCIMGYDYYWSGSTTAGPTDPLYNFQTSYNYTLSRSITYYLDMGVPNSKLVLGLPYYGREWPTAASTIPSATTASGVSRTYDFVRTNSTGNYNTAQWDANSFTPYYAYNNGNWNQCFINSAWSLGKRYDVVNQTGIAGIGIWALGYDDGYTELWDKLREKFSDCGTIACTDTVYDLGGPNRNYYDNENYTYTIAPTGANSVSLAFSSFDVELNYDTLWLYDGPSTSSPLIGSYTGTNSPGTVNSTGSTLTMRFKSDGGVVNPGWTAVWSCSIDNTPPTTQVSAPTGWITQNFTASFTDADNTGGSGLEKSFYQVLEYDGTEWRANNGNGFFSDNFDAAIHPDWAIASGTWSINGGYLNQTDQTNTNTNIYAPLTQNLSNRYLFNWAGKIDGTGTNRRAGFHFFCDDGSQTNRGNSYFVWFRVDQSQLQFYKVVNNVFGSPVSTVPVTITAGTWYDYKVTFDRITGKMDVYMNDALVGSWTDPAPYSTGNHISFRSGDCDYMVNNLKVYRSRFPSVTVSVGAASTNDIRYQSPNPTTAAGRIKSIVNDAAGNLSTVSSQDVFVDWTSPADVTIIYDGTATDIDTTNSLTQLSANWIASSDPHSGVAAYWYAIGTAPGAADVVSWTNNALNTSVTHTGLSLVNGQWYYFSIQAESGAGLVSNVTSSDGQVAWIATGISEQDDPFGLIVYPNPFSDAATINYSIIEEAGVKIELLDVTGKLIEVIADEKQPPGRKALQIDAGHIAKGIYLLKLQVNGKAAFVKLAVN
jgi:spore germination protein YaaH